MLQSQLYHLYESQLREWEIVRQRYSALQAVKERTLYFPGSKIRITCNPDRIRSSAAKTDLRHLSERSCFLCETNRPEEQKGMNWKEHYTLLLNPFPIFRHHFTIVANTHTPQLLNSGRITDMLRLARELPDFTIFYNGPQCGASAPDHFHFQAGNRHFMPIEEEMDEGTEILFHTKGLSVKYKTDTLRPVILIASKSAEVLSGAVLHAQEAVNRVVSREPEPMLNILTFYQDETWQVCLFPRKAHRPRQFFETGEKQIVFSPGAVDFGGVLILPREHDFNRLTPELITDLFHQLVPDETEFNQIKNHLQSPQLWK